MKIKKNDTVVVITGKDKGKRGRVLKALPKDNKVIVEGVNVLTKHAKRTRTTASEIKHQEFPIHVSNVMYYESRTKAPTRIAYKGTGEDKVRVSKRSGAELD